MPPHRGTATGNERNARTTHARARDRELLHGVRVEHGEVLGAGRPGRCWRHSRAAVLRRQRRTGSQRSRVVPSRCGQHLASAGRDGSSLFVRVVQFYLVVFL